MPYPHTILTRPMRRIIMFFLIATFFVISPLIIFYTAGYRYDFTTHQIKQTGVISIDVEPVNATVYLNNVLINKKIPIRLPNRAPGTYHLKIVAPGYQTWDKEISVESKQTSYIRNISLFKQTLPVEILDFSKENVTNGINVSLSPFGDHALITKNNNNIIEISAFNLKTNTATPITRLPEKQTYLPQISWSPYYSVAFIKTKQESGWQYQIFNPADIKLNNNIFSFSTEPTNVQWNKNPSNPSLLVSEGDNIYELNSTDQNKKKLVSLPDLSPIWYADKNTQIWQFNQTNNNIALIYPEGKNIAYATDGTIDEIININEQRIIARTGEEIKIIPIDNGNPGNRRSINTQHLNYNTARDEWLMWSNYELWSIYPDGFANILQRESKNIQQVAPLDSYGLLLLVADNSLYGFNPGYYVTHELFKGEEITAAQINITDKKIFFIGKVGTKTGLFSLDY